MTVSVQINKECFEIQLKVNCLMKKKIETSYFPSLD